jgi:hypothetical protein
MNASAYERIAMHTQREVMMMMMFIGVSRLNFYANHSFDV